MTKERGEDKIYFGPICDLDLAFDNDIFLYPIKKTIILHLNIAIQMVLHKN